MSSAKRWGVLLSSDPRPLARFWQAVANEDATASRISADAAYLTGVADALAGVAAENDTWRTTVAEPAIAAVQGGSVDAVNAAIQTQIQDQEVNQAATDQFVLTIDAVEAELTLRSEHLSGLRGTATACGRRGGAAVLPCHSGSSDAMGCESRATRAGESGTAPSAPRSLPRFGRFGRRRRRR